jgi:predicted phage terminase large subunit-like protein
LKQTYADAQEKRPRGSRPLRVQGVHQHQNKMQRISTLEPEISNGYLLFAETLTPRLLDQLTLFPTTYDDGPDALHGAVEQLKKPTSTQMYERFYDLNR